MQYRSCEKHIHRKWQLSRARLIIRDGIVTEKEKEKRFTPPNLEEVTLYCKSRKNNVNAQRFIDYYTAKGWMVGANKMKDWRAAVRLWEQNDKKTSNTQAPVDHSLDEIL